MSHPYFYQSRFAYRNDGMHTLPLAGVDAPYRGIFQDHGYALPSYVANENDALNGFMGNYVSSLGEDTSMESQMQACELLKSSLKQLIDEAIPGELDLGITKISASDVWSYIQAPLATEMNTLLQKTMGGADQVVDWVLGKIPGGSALKYVAGPAVAIIKAIADKWVAQVKSLGTQVQACMSGATAAAAASGSQNVTGTLPVPAPAPTPLTQNQMTLLQAFAASQPKFQAAVAKPTWGSTTPTASAGPLVSKSMLPILAVAGVGLLFLLRK